jgi:hypothetical protein
MTCPSSPPCTCPWHRAQITAFEAWQEEMNETHRRPAVEGDTLDESWNCLS